jgi:cob(I)alamin adenosyltransferase
MSVPGVAFAGRGTPVSTEAEAGEISIGRRKTSASTGGTGGRVILFTGDGKGKTTAAFGATLRALGSGWRVAVVQFIKGPWASGEVTALAGFPGICILKTGGGFTWKASDPEEPKRLAQSGWSRARELALSDEYELLVLDELTWVVNEGYVGIQEVLDFLSQKPERLSVIITGSNASVELVQAADTVTEMRMVKHPYAEGLQAEPGIEY